MLNDKLPEQVCALKKNFRRVLLITSPAAVFVLALFAGQAFAQTAQKTQVEFVNVADSTQGLGQFSQFPAINHRGVVAFVAKQGVTEQSVFKWEGSDLTAIATTTGSSFTFFTDDVVINNSGVVGFRATLNTGGRAAGIFTSDGFTTRTIINSTAQGLPGPGIGSPSINSSGTVAFEAFRNGFRSSIIFTGDGETLTQVLDSLNSSFGSFGVVAINDAGEIVFRAQRTDRNEGIFVMKPQPVEPETNAGVSAGTARVIELADTSNTDFGGFGDPVINNSGTVADFAEVGAGLEIISGNSRGIIARTDPVFADLEHPSINERGAVAFSALEADGSVGMFVELTGGASPFAVLQSGDPLFGSTVTAVSVGRFAFNNDLQLAFEYELADGRSGIAVALMHIR